MKKEFDLKINLFFGKKTEAAIVFKAIKHLIQSKEHLKRSAITIRLKKDILCIDIKASDLTALRATLFSCFKAIALSRNLVEVR